MRPPSDMPRRPPRSARRRRLASGRGRIVLVVALVALFILATSLRGIAGFYTDYLWFDSLDLSGVWSYVLGAKVSLVLIFTALFFVIMWVNLAVAERLSGRTLRFGGSNEDELVLRYRELVGPRSRLVRGSVAGLLALVAGSGAASQWESWVLFRNPSTFGQQDAIFGLDVGFYVFRLPFLRFVAGWLFSALIVVLVATVVVHYLNGGIRMQAARDRVSAQVKAHVSVLLAALALVRAGQYYLDRYDLVFSSRGPVDGAAYTDVNVQLKAIYLLILISMFATALFLANIWRRGWVLPVMAVGLWGLVAVLAGEAVPAFVQRARVEPNESALEREYIQNNIDATRFALGLDGIEERPFDVDYDLTGEQLTENGDTVENIRLWDTAQLRDTFQRVQGLSEFYDISDVDVDRYMVDGQLQQVMVATRRIEDDKIPRKTWETSRLVYTSGYGVVMAPANAKTGNGQPRLVARDVPMEVDEGYPTVEEPSLYFGEDQPGYKIVDTKRDELLYAEDDESGGGERDAHENYDGADGVTLDSTVRRAAFALRFGEFEPLLSSSIEPGSRVLLRRDVIDRVETLAPFLAFDHDPYATVIDGRIVYVVDGYTTTDRFPNAQRVDVGEDLPDDSGLAGRSFNYVRNSVKVTVDAYDGTVDMYVTDRSDPLIRTYDKAFPELFQPVSEAPEGLREHFRYPEDLFRVQTSMWGRYHVSDPDRLLQVESRWRVAPEPDAQNTEDAPATTTTAAEGGSAPAGSSDRQRGIDPTYQLVRLPGEEEQSFVLVRPMTPASRSQLATYLAATPDGEIVSFLPRGASPDGPGLAADGMRGDEEVARLLDFYSQEGSEITFGNVLLVPIEESILYVRPMYVASQSRSPRIQQVVVSFQAGPDESEVVVKPTLDQALVEIFGVSPGTLEEEPAEPSPIDEGDEPGGGEEEPDEAPDEQPSEDEPESTFDGDDDALVAAIEEEFDAADTALRDGDLATWTGHIERAEELVRELARRRQAAGGGGGDPPAGDAPTTTTAPASSGGGAGDPSGSPPTTRPSA